MRNARFAGALLALAVIASAGPAAAATRVVTIEPAYERSAFAEWILGRNWRVLWVTPIEVTELDLDAIGGGLRPVEPIGGYQTVALALEGADGRSYTFRRLKKFAAHVLPAWIRRGPVELLLRDQASGNFPGAEIVAARLSRQLDVLVTERQLVWMPDDAALGSFREEFGGVTGTLSEYPKPGQNGSAGTFGITEIRSSDELWKLERRGQGPGVDARAYLRARLLDWWVGDWDRHPEQWRWALVAGANGWRPLPEDHDHAFSHYEGLIVTLLRPFAPWLAPFESDLSVDDMSRNSRRLDAWLLVGLDRRAWQETIAAFRGGISERSIDEAVALLPQAWQRPGGDRIRRILRERLEKLPIRALELYDALARRVDVHGSDSDDRARLHCRDDGSLELILSDAGGEQRLERTFSAQETRSITLHLYGGSDRVTRSGASSCRIEVTQHSGAEMQLERGVPAPRTPPPPWHAEPHRRVAR